MTGEIGDPWTWGPRPLSCTISHHSPELSPAYRRYVVFLAYVRHLHNSGNQPQRITEPCVPSAESSPDPPVSDFRHTTKIYLCRNSLILPSPTASVPSVPSSRVRSLRSSSPFHAMPSSIPQNNHVSALPTGYRFAMASVIDDAKKKGTEAKYVFCVCLLFVCLSLLLFPRWLVEFNCL